MKPTPELAVRLSEITVKIILSALVLAVLAFGLAEKFREAERFEAFAQYQIARVSLGAQLSDLEEEDCWKQLIRARPGEALASRISLLEIDTLECSDQFPNQVRIAGRVFETRPADRSAQSPQEPCPLPIENCQYVPINQSAAALPSGLQIWLGSVNIDPLIRCSVAQVIAGGLALLMIIFAAYARAAINAGAASTKGTMFSVLIGSSLSEMAGFILICIPLGSLVDMASAMPWPSQNGCFAALCALVVGVVTVQIATRITPLTSLNVAQAKRDASAGPSLG